MRTKRILRGLLEVRKNAASVLPFYHQYNAYLFNRRYKKGSAPWCGISDGLFHWLSKLRDEAVRLVPHGRILEIGCGDGALTAQLSRDSREVMGGNSLIICEDVLYYIPFVSMKKVVNKLTGALVGRGILLVIDYLPQDMETRYYYRLLSRYLAPIRIEPITYQPENARFMIAVYRRAEQHLDSD